MKRPQVDPWNFDEMVYRPAPKKNSLGSADNRVLHGETISGKELRKRIRGKDSPLVNADVFWLAAYYAGSRGLARNKGVPFRRRRTMPATKTEKHKYRNR